MDLNSINAILITHEHTDHTKCLNMLSNKYDIPIYITKKHGTLYSIKKKIIIIILIFLLFQKNFILKI